MRSWVLALVLLVPLPAAAQTDLGARVTPAGLTTLTDLALARVPSVFSIERMDPTLFDCPGDDLVAHIPPTDVNIAFRDLDIRTEDGAIVLSTELDIDVANTIQLDNANACLGISTCDVSANLDRLGIVIELGAASSPDGGIEFHGASVDLMLASEDLAIDSTGCAVGEVATWLFEAFETWALELLTPRLEMLIGERLGAALTELFAETVGVSVDYEGFSIEAWLDSLDLTRLLGATVGGGADITWTGEVIYDDPAPMTSAPEGTALPDDLPGDFQIAISDRLVTDSLYEAWRGGLLRRLLAQQTTSIDLAGDGAASLIGLNDGASMEISIDIEQPMSATFGRVGPDVAEVSLDGLHVTVDVTTPSGGASTIEVFASGVLQAALTSSAEVGGLVLDVRDLSMSSLRIDTAGEDLELDQARLTRMMESTVAPMLGDRLRNLPVAPGLIAVAGAYVHVRAVSSAGGWQRVGADIHVPNPDDFMPPDTTLTDPADLLAAGTAAFEVTGTDDSTPPELLRYRAWLDGAPLDEGEPSGLRVLRFDVTGGTHTLEVAAVDLNDNVDPTPATHVFEVDDTPPSLNVTSFPAAIVSEDVARATWNASDPEGPVESRWILRQIGEDAMATIIQESPFSPDTNEAAIPASTLSSGTLYELEIVARDEAGNVTSRSFGFALSGGGGCSASGPERGRGGGLWLLALGLCALVLRRRR